MFLVIITIYNCHNLKVLFLLFGSNPCGIIIAKLIHRRYLIGTTTATKKGFIRMRSQNQIDFYFYLAEGESFAVLFIFVCE